MVIFSVIYILFLFAYFVTRVGNSFILRLTNKYVLATMYMVYAIVMFGSKNCESYHYMLLLGLFFAYLGDIFLVFSFRKGGIYFLLGNVCFSAFYLSSLNEYSISFINYFWIFIIWIMLIGLFVYIAKKYPNVLKLGKMKYPMIFYLSSITLHGLLGLVCAIFIGTNSFVVMGIGSILFMISDYILTIDRFVVKKNKWITRSNSLTYFVGILLIVLGFGL